jgi:hypothetical protein
LSDLRPQHLDLVADYRPEFCSFSLCNQVTHLQFISDDSNWLRRTFQQACGGVCCAPSAASGFAPAADPRDSHAEATKVRIELPRADKSKLLSQMWAAGQETDYKTGVIHPRGFLRPRNCATHPTREVSGVNQWVTLRKAVEIHDCGSRDWCTQPPMTPKEPRLGGGAPHTLQVVSSFPVRNAIVLSSRRSP